LSKGLGAPVGSLVVCDADRAGEARVLRHRLGGGWRQAGILAAAGLYALEHHIGRLADDHTRARRLATTLAEAVPDICDPAAVETNIIRLDLHGTGIGAEELAGKARAEGVLVSTVDDAVRVVTHLDVDDAGCEYAAGVLRRILVDRS
jgi:threonine aldolase